MGNRIGETAGKVWHALNEHGQQELPQLAKMINEKGLLVHAAVGWLAREEKVDICMEGKKVTVKLSS